MPMPWIDGWRACLLCGSLGGIPSKEHLPRPGVVRVAIASKLWIPLAIASKKIGKCTAGIGIDVPIVGDLLKPSPKQIFVGIYIPNSWLMWNITGHLRTPVWLIYQFNMVIFHTCVSLPEAMGRMGCSYPINDGHFNGIHRDAGGWHEHMVASGDSLAI